MFYGMFFNGGIVYFVVKSDLLMLFEDFVLVWFIELCFVLCIWDMVFVEFYSEVDCCLVDGVD